MQSKNRNIVRVQTGVRIEKHILMVLKAIAARHEISLGDLIEGMALHNFEGKAPFSTSSLEFIDKIRDAYGLSLTAADSHLLAEDQIEKR